jgi:deoxyribonuclease-4
MKQTILKQKFGAHMSVAGGFENAFDAAKRAGCDCLALFVKNQRQWKAPPLSDAQVWAFRQAQARTGIGPVVAHASYLLNLASPTAEGRDKSIAALIDELQRCEALGVPFLVVHPGAHLGEGEDAGIRRIVYSIEQVHAATCGFKTLILLESTAGQGTTIGHDLSQLGRILAAVRDGDQLGVCLDTCHLFAAGYDLRKKPAYESMMEELVRHVGLDRVKCIHTNDSKGALGSRIDRHEHITKGKIGKAGFANLLNDVRLAAVPRILETPKGTDGRGVDLDRVNMARLRRIVEA